MQNKELTVLKYYPDGRLGFSYMMQLLNETPNRRDIFGVFKVRPHKVGNLSFEPGDHFYESYFNNRPYNIYEVHQQDTARVKCWYFNISTPAVFHPQSIVWTDYALDLLVYPDGSLQLLDQDELAAWNLPLPDYWKVWNALDNLLTSLKKEAPRLMPGLPQIQFADRLDKG